MLHVSLIVEALRAQPRLLFWSATLLQAALWLAVPALFYAAPPGALPVVLAVGHEWQMGTVFGAPLAFWLAEIAFNAAGGSIVGPYLLSQVCVIVTFWAVFALGRSIVGVQHAVLATLLMGGVLLFSVATPDFGPAVLAMPLTALTLLWFWRGLGEGRWTAWIAAGVALGLLLLTTPAGLLLASLMAVFTLATNRGRAALRTPFPLLAAALAVTIALPYALWLRRTGMHLAIGDARLPHSADLAARLAHWAELLGMLVAAHVGFIALVMIAAGRPRRSRVPAPAFPRMPVKDFAKTFVLVFALAPPLLATLAAALTGRPEPIGGAGWVVVLTGLALVVAVGDVIVLQRQRILGYAWLAVVLLPPLATILALGTAPFVGIDLQANQPARAMAQFFTETFHRRTNSPLQTVAGDARLASLVALESPDRPRVFLDADPRRAAWIDADRVKANGGIVVWPITDPLGTAPPQVRTQFPELVAEVPETFERTIDGSLPPLRLGWGMIRPQQTEEGAPVAAQ